MSINNLKSDMIELIELSGEISMYNQMLLHHSNMKDKRNYNPEKCSKIQLKVSKLQERFYYLKDKWFSN